MLGEERDVTAHDRSLPTRAPEPEGSLLRGANRQGNKSFVTDFRYRLRSMKRTNGTIGAGTPAPS